MNIETNNQSVVLAMPENAAQIAQRRKRFPADPLSAFRSQAPGPFGSDEHEQLGRWNHFEERCEMMKCRSLPASEDTVLRYTTERVHLLRGGKEGDAPLSISAMRETLTVIAFVHVYLGFRNPTASACSYLRACSHGSTHTPSPRLDLMSLYLAQPARTLTEKRAQCVVALVYWLLLKAPEVVTLKVEDYRRATAQTPAALRLTSPIAHRRRYWQPLPELLVRILDEWIDAADITGGYLICDARRNQRGNPMCPKLVGDTLRKFEMGGRPTCVRALHRKLFDDVFGSNKVELVGMQPCMHQGARMIKFGSQHPFRERRAVCERTPRHG